MPTPPAAVTPGDIYVDAGPRTLWLGVDPVVDPAGAVLISDIVGTTAAIAAAIVAAGAYTDAQVATRAPTAHTHTSAQITDFAAAVAAIIAASPSAAIPVGLIAMYSGSIANIGTGTLASWHLCDGTGGTPDLRDKFVLGAGIVATGVVNPSATAATSAAGAHTPAINATTLTAAQIPAHVHPVNLSGTDTATTSAAANHTHTAAVPLNKVGQATAGFDVNFIWVGNGGTDPTGAAGTHSHTVTVNVPIVGNTGNPSGGGGSHTHTATAVADHTHTVSSTNLKNAIPWYAVAFIMKIS